MWAILRPQVPFAPGEDGAGSVEIGGMLLLCLARIWIMNRQSNLVGALDSNMMTRDQVEFWSLFRQVGLVAAISTVHRNTYKYVEDRLGLMWRNKLTAKVHRMYFSEMAYYHIAQNAAINSGICDADDRITDDIKLVSNEMAHVFCEGLYAMTAGGFFAWKLGQLYGGRYAVAPYIYLWGTFALTQKLAPLNWGKISAEVRRMFSSYRGAVTHLVTNQEAVAALKGADVELGIIGENFDAVCKLDRKNSRRTVWYGLVNQLGFQWWLKAFVGMFVFGPHVFFPSVTDLSSLDQVAKLRGNLGHQFVLFIQSMIAAGVTAKMGKQLQKVAGSAGRVNELIVNLKEMAEARQLRLISKTLDTRDVIEFRDVTVVTPTGNTLVEGLTFSVAKGKSMLLTGHNGAGKSSIFRCLGGLWKIPKGEISKPGYSECGLHQEVFYLPQKPYNVLGTLFDQLTYPATGKDDASASISKSVLVDILERVDLLYLINRPGVLTDEINWEEALSLGEKQRLAMARLIYHRPNFAILDECTSAVSGAMERRLYDMCNEMQITYITISHRPALRMYHDEMLTIGDGKCGWKLEKIDRSKIQSEEYRNDIPCGGSARQNSLDTDTSSGTIIPSMEIESSTKIKSRNSSKFGTLARLLRLLSLSVDTKSVWKLVGIIGTIGIQCAIMLLLSRTGSQMMGSVFDQKPSKFVGLCKKMMIYSGAAAVVEQVHLYFQREINLDIKTGLGNNLHKRFLEHNNFYKLVQTGEISDASARITDDVKTFADTSSEMFAELLKPVVDISLYAIQLRMLVGTYATSLLFGYLIGGATLIRYSLPNFKRIVAIESAEDSRFKLVHTRVRTHAESIAFFGGDSREHAIARSQFKKVSMLHSHRLSTNWTFGLVNQAIIREAPMLTQWLLRNAYGQQYGSDSAIQADNGVKLNGNQLFIYEAVMNTFDAISRLLGFVEKFASYSGIVVRIAELDEALLTLEARNGGRDIAIIPSTDHTVSFDGVNIMTPTGQTLAEGVTLSVSHSTPLMVTGPNASGKTSFFRVLAGLWPHNNGKISCPCGSDGVPNIKDLFLVPQRIYMVLGSLTDQVVYPERCSVRTPEIETRLQEVLELVGIGYLSSREGGWDAVLKWQDVLSLGEQQRLGMARLFYHRPLFGVLDECTSAVSVDVEDRLYQEANRLGITCITMSQRLALDEYHSQELKLGEVNEKQWLLSNISN